MFEIDNNCPVKYRRSYRLPSCKTRDNIPSDEALKDSRVIFLLFFIIKAKLFPTLKPPPRHNKITIRNIFRQLFTIQVFILSRLMINSEEDPTSKFLDSTRLWNIEFHDDNVYIKINVRLAHERLEGFRWHFTGAEIVLFEDTLAPFHLDEIS